MRSLAPVILMSFQSVSWRSSLEFDRLLCSMHYLVVQAWRGDSSLHRNSVIFSQVFRSHFRSRCLLYGSFAFQRFECIVCICCASLCFAILIMACHVYSSNSPRLSSLYPLVRPAPPETFDHYQAKHCFDTISYAQRDDL